jgi:transcriptional regulator GlxA family with amidase domain
MQARRKSNPAAVFRVDIAWDPQMLGGPAQAILDVFRTINALAAMREPRRQAPVVWRWVHACGARMPAMWPRSAGYRGVADLLVIPGWHGEDGPHLDRLVNAATPLAERALRIHGQGGQVLAVFTGTALVASTGLLRGRQVVGPWPFLAAILRQDETLRWVTDQPWTCDNRIWTCDAPAHATDLLLAILDQGPWAQLALAARHIVQYQPQRQQVAARIVQDIHRRVLPAGAVERAKRWLDAHIAEPYDLNATARAAATSPRTLLRHFASTLGQSPLDYLHGLRVARARVLLETTYSSVEQIAHMCGYQDPGSFRRIFVATAGELPAAYREHYRLRTSRKRWRGAST